jgi:hypothetical protein
MNTRSAQGRPAGRTRPSPELVAVGLVVILYGGLLGVGPIVLGGVPAPAAEVAPPAASPSPSAPHPPSSDPFRAGIQGILEIDGRLTQAGQDLNKAIARTPFRGSEAAILLRRIQSTLLTAVQRVAALAVDPATREIGAQLEILYASANTTVDKASDLALGNDREYRQAAGEIVDLFRDLPAIDKRLAAVLARGATESAPPSPPPSAIVTASPSSPPSPVVSASPTASPNPAELLRDPGFESGLQVWTRRATGGAPLPATSPAAPLGAQGTQSLRVDVSSTTSIAGASIGQEPVALKAGSRYLLTIAIRADTARSVQLRVVGPAEETYGITLVNVGPTATVARLEFMSSLDQPVAAFWIDLGGPKSGTVWLDDASLTAETP